MRDFKIAALFVEKDGCYFNLPRKGGWVKADEKYNGWTCRVEQGRYGHWMRKPTWLLVYGVAREDLPELDWGTSRPNYPQKAIKKYGIKKVKRMGEMAFRGGGVDSSPRNATPEKFRDLLIEIALKSKKGS